LSIKLDYYSGRLSTYKLDRTIVTVGAPRMMAMSTCPASAGASSCAPAAVALLRPCGHHSFCSSSRGFRALLMSRGLALQLLQKLFNSGGWATTPSGFPHYVPLAFIALISRLRLRHLMQERKLSHQQVNSRD
jgi:hypothetical protein